MSFLHAVANLFINPFFWVLGLLLVALLIRKKRCRMILVGSAITVMLLFSNPYIHRVTTQAWEPPPVLMTDLAKASPYDYGIVLGGFMRTHGRPLDRLHLNDSADRFSQAIELYHLKKVSKLVFVSGATTGGHEPVNEAEMARVTAIRFGVPEADVIALSTSRNTYENAVEFAEFLGQSPQIESLLLITSATHMPRAVSCFQKQGLAPEVFPTDHRTNYDSSSPDTLASLLFPSPATFTSWRTLFREWLAMLAYRIRGRI